MDFLFAAGSGDPARALEEDPAILRRFADAQRWDELIEICDFLGEFLLLIESAKVVLLGKTKIQCTIASRTRQKSHVLMLVDHRSGADYDCQRR